jgi:hypothetical protein
MDSTVFFDGLKILLCTWNQSSLEKLLEFAKIESTVFEEVAFFLFSCSYYKHLDKFLIKTNNFYMVIPQIKYFCSFFNVQ